MKMDSEDFTGIVLFMFKKTQTTVYKYAIIRSQCPETYKKSIDKFKNIYDLNNLEWTTSKSKAYEIANENEKNHTTSHGIVLLDYTNIEPIETKIMYSSEYKYLNGIKNVSHIGFNIILHTLYLLFIIKLYSNLYY